MKAGTCSSCIRPTVLSGNRKTRNVAPNDLDFSQWTLSSAASTGERLLVFRLAGKQRF